jgi:hypothetical protein
MQSCKNLDVVSLGVMKRWGFAGMRKTHGVTKSHRYVGENLALVVIKLFYLILIFCS